MPKTYQPIGCGMTPSTTDAGTFLRARRLKLGLSQVEVARRAGIGQGNYSALERGKFGSRSLSHRVDVLARALECDLSELQVLILAPPKPKTDLGKLISARRQELGLEIVELAERTGLRKQHLRQLEYGTKSALGYTTARKLAQGLSLDISAFKTFTQNWGFKGREADTLLGARIRSRRMELGLSTGDVASLLQVTPQLISAIECGKIFLQNDDRLVQFAAVLQMNPEELRRLCPKRRLSSRRKFPLEPGSLAAFVFERRLDLRLSQREVSERARIAPNAIFRIESGNAHQLAVDADFWRNLGGVLECEIPQTLIPVAEESKRRGLGMYTKSKTALGKFLTDRRTELGLSRDTVAQKAGISPQKLYTLERGIVRSLRLNDREKLAEALQCDIEKLIPDLVRVPTEPQSKPEVSDVRSEDFKCIKELSGIEREDAERKGVRLLRRLLERQHDGFSIFFAKDGALVELELFL